MGHLLGSYRIGDHILAKLEKIEKKPRHKLHVNVRDLSKAGHSKMFFMFGSVIIIKS